jgi:hypothetical protein
MNFPWQPNSGFIFKTETTYASMAWYNGKRHYRPLLERKHSYRPATELNDYPTRHM